MDDDSSEQKVDPSMVAEIVSRYVAKNSIAIDQIGGLIDVGTSHAQRSRHECAGDDTRSGKGDTGGADPAIGTARLCRLPRMRISRENPAPAS